tara:strand:- start:1496 stop:1780 length:285 start_codon:yes stop_codon:yes gene_type:complete
VARFAATANGNIPYSAEREALRDAEEAALAVGANDRAMATLREKRNRLLHESDWWASSDLTITQAQKDYRIALRDLPANTADPANPTWPTKPGD